MAHEREAPTGRDEEVDLTQRPVGLPGIPKADPLETNAALRRRRVAGVRRGPVRALVRSAHGHAQVGEEVRQVQVVLEHAAQGAEHTLKRLLPMTERQHVQGHGAQRDAPGHGLERDGSIRAVEGEGGEQGPQVAVARPLDREGAVLAVEALGEPLVAPEQERPEP